MLEKTVKRILNADVYVAAVETPLDVAALLSARLGNKVWIKREDLQEVFSFKIRGAYNKMSSLSETQRSERGNLRLSRKSCSGVSSGGKAHGGEGKPSSCL